MLCDLVIITIQWLLCNDYYNVIFMKIIANVFQEIKIIHLLQKKVQTELCYTANLEIKSLLVIKLNWF